MVYVNKNRKDIGFSAGESKNQLSEVIELAMAQIHYIRKTTGVHTHAWIESWINDKVRPAIDEVKGIRKGDVDE
ncbi:MAG: hypothetical protein ACTSW1_07215 [Candidatus Hodarchaeales archaeon]